MFRGKRNEGAGPATESDNNGQQGFGFEVGPGASLAFFPGPLGALAGLPISALSNIPITKTTNATSSTTTKVNTL